MRWKVALLLTIALLTAVIGAYLYQGLQARRAYDSRDLIRLHVIANSNSLQDQQVKYLVRDSLVSALRPELSKATSLAEARCVLSRNRNRIVDIARDTLRRAGFNYPVRLLYGRFQFPARAYGNLVLPAGDYEAVKLVLGEGKGKNWWCVLFPPLCFVDAASERSASSSYWDQSYTAATAGEVGGAEPGTPSVEDQVELRWRLLDWLRGQTDRLARRGSR